MESADSPDLPVSRETYQEKNNPARKVATDIVHLNQKTEKSEVKLDILPKWIENKSKGTQISVC